MTSTTPSVSDVRREAVETEGFDPKDDSAVPVRQTPFPTSPLNEGAVEAKPAAYLLSHPEYGDGGISFNPLTEADNRAGYSSEPLYSASAVTTLLTNLAEAQRERDLAEQWLGEETARAETAESRLTHLQTRLEEVEGALEPYARLHPASFGAIVAAMSSRFETLKGTRSGAAAYYDLEAIKTMADGHQRARAALQSKGESK